MKPVGILTALEAEQKILLDQLKVIEVHDVAGFRIYQGAIEGIPVVLSQSDAGKVNAATLATLMADRFKCRALMFSGVAGGLNPAHSVGDLLIASSIIQHDYGATIDRTIQTYHPGDHCIGPRQKDLPFLADEALIKRLKSDLPSPPLFGQILTGDQFINCEKTRVDLFNQHGGDAVEMEGGAVAQVAQRFNIPWVVIRCLSDLAGDSSDIDFTAFLDEAAAKAARLGVAVLKLI